MSGLLRTRELLRHARLEPSYDVVIVGGGGQGLATAYYLAARHGIRKVAVIERAYIGGGASGRNTTVTRSNYMLPESVRFYDLSDKAYDALSAELDFNLLVSRRVAIDMVHYEDSLARERRRAQSNTLCGVDTHMISPQEVERMVPAIDLNAGGRPIIASSWHNSAIVRHDAVVWGYAAAATRLGVHIHQGVEVTGIACEGGRVTGVETTAGRVRAGVVLSAVAASTTQVAGMAGVRVPIVTTPLQAFVTEPYKPVFDPIVGSSDGGMIVYVSQSARGELLVGAEIDPYQSHATSSTLDFIAYASRAALALLPFMAPLRILRQWTGVCDRSPDASPILDVTEVGGFYLSTGWGTGGFKAIPVGGMGMAELIATGRAPEHIAPYALTRFRDDGAISEGASTGTH